MDQNPLGEQFPFFSIHQPESIWAPKFLFYILGIGKSKTYQNIQMPSTEEQFS